MSPGPKTLLLDIETTPSLGWVWGKYDQDVIEFEEDWYILCCATKWLDQKKINCFALPDYPLYKKNPKNDKAVLEDVWQQLDQADIVVAHNGDKFDLRKLNARFVIHGFLPPSPYKTVDTLKLARKHFSFTSCKLNELGKALNLGTKLNTGGIRLWFDCMDGKASAWKKMKAYNKQDVSLLEEAYLRLRTWSRTHPNHNVFAGTQNHCPTCGSDKLQKRGFNVSRVGRYQRFQCLDCGAWSQAGKSQFAARIR